MKLKNNKLTLEELYHFLESPFSLNDFKNRVTRIINGEDIIRLHMCKHCPNTGNCNVGIPECNDIRRAFFKKLNVICDSELKKR